MLKRMSAAILLALSSQLFAAMPSSPTLWLKADTGITSSGGFGTEITTWADQSGNGYDVTGATDNTAKPKWVMDRNAFPAVRFAYGYSTAHPKGYFTLSNSMTMTSTRAISVFAVASSTNSISNYPIIAFNGFAAQFYGGSNTGNTRATNLICATTAPSTKLYIPLNPSILGVVSGASATTEYVNGLSSSGAAIASASPSAGGLLGKYSTTYWTGDFYEVVVYNRALNGSEVTDMLAYLNGKYSFLQSSYTKRVIFVGDSMTEGVQTTDNQMYSRKSYPADMECYNMGVGGDIIGGTSAAGSRARISSHFDNLWNASYSNYIVLNEGSNDLVSGGATDGADCFTRLTAFFGEVAALHTWSGYYATTIPDRGNTAGLRAKISAYNTLIRGGNAAYTGYSDPGYGGDNVLTRFDLNTNTTYFDGDGIHPNNRGSFCFAGHIYAKVTGSPVAPENVTATKNGSARIDLTWSDASSSATTNGQETGFKCYYKASGASSWTLGATASADASSASITGLSPGTTYYTKVVSYNGTAESTWYGVYGATTDANAAPTCGTLAPDTKTIYQYGTAINFVGLGNDAEDGSLTGSSLSWSSSRDGALGTGGSISVSTLSYGFHTITLTATDSVSQTATATLSIWITRKSATATHNTRDYYVSTAGNDANDGSTWALAKRTVQNAITTAGTAGGAKIIAVAPGWYETEASGRDAFDTTESGDTITAYRYDGVDGGSAVCPAFGGNGVLLASTNFNVLWFKTSVTSGTFDIDGIDAHTTDANQQVMFDNVNTTATATIRNCLLDGWSYMNGTLGVSRTITYNNVGFVNPSNTGWIGCNSVGSLSLVNCWGTTSATAPTSPVVNLGSAASASFKSVVISGCTFTQNYYSNTYALISPVTPTAGVLDIHNCTLAGKGTVVKILGTSSGTPRLKCYANTITMTADGVSNRDVRAIQVGDLDDTVTTTAEGPVIRGNIIAVNGTRTGHSNGIFIGKGVSGGTVFGNKVYGAGADQGIFLLSQYCAVVNNSVAVYNGGDAIICEESLGNQILANSIYGGAAESTGFVLCFRDGSTNLKQPLKNIAIDNLIYGGGTSTNAYGFSAHTGTMTVSSNILDWNVYYLSGGGSGGLGVIDGSQSDSRNPLALINWSTYLNGSQLNDQNSVISNPRFASPSTGNLTVSLSSPAKGLQNAVGAPADWNTKGAFERKAGAGQQSFVGDNP